MFLVQTGLVALKKTEIEKTYKNRCMCDLLVAIQFGGFHGGDDCLLTAEILLAIRGISLVGPAGGLLWHPGSITLLLP